MTFDWLLGGDCDPVMEGKKKPGETVYISQFDDIDGMERFLRACLRSLEEIKGQMQKYED